MWFGCTALVVKLMKVFSEFVFSICMRFLELQCDELSWPLYHCLKTCMYFVWFVVIVCTLAAPKIASHRIFQSRKYAVYLLHLTAF